MACGDRGEVAPEMMGGALRTAVRLARDIGLDPTRLRHLRHLSRFFREMAAYRRAGRTVGPPLTGRDLYPILSDYDGEAGTAAGHYFHQDLWAARKIFRRAPAEHIDVGSRIDGFVGHLLSFRSVTVVDIRPLTSVVPGLTFVQSDATRLSDFADGSIDSLSSLHAAEHLGLGRYGDPIDPDACFTFMRALQRVLAPGGRLYFSVPVGQERLEFNAHRVLTPHTVVETFTELELVSFSAVNDDGAFQEDVTPQTCAGAHFACGIFEFVRRQPNKSATQNIGIHRGNRPGHR